VEAASTLPEDERYGPGFGFPSSRPQKICVNLRNLRIEKAPPAEPAWAMSRFEKQETPGACTNGIRRAL
jgi:hypothetical protein